MNMSFKRLHWRWCVLVTFIYAFFWFYQSAVISLRVLDRGLLQEESLVYVYMPLQLVAAVGLLLRRQWAILWAWPLAFSGVTVVVFNPLAGLALFYLSSCIILAYAKPGSDQSSVKPDQV